MSTQTIVPGETTEPLRHPIVSREEWLTARQALLQKEKALTRQIDAVRAERIRLPWVKVEKQYLFTGPDGRKTLGDLFAGRSQLIIYHFMLGPDWEEGCPGCSFLADHIDGPNLHLAHHDVTLMAVSRAPWEKLAAFKKRMGWHFSWASSFGSDFNYDYGVSFTPEQVEGGQSLYNFGSSAPQADELPGVSAFYRDANGDIFHTYSSYGRGLDILLGAHNFLDMAPKGRNESGVMDWMRHHDRYDDVACGNSDGKESSCDCH